MPTFDWLPFLIEYSRVLLADPELRARLPDEVVQSGWMGFPGAAETEIVSLERRLGIALPPSYRQFLAISNGWRSTGTFIDAVRPAAQVAWFRERNQDWIDAYVQPALDLPSVLDDEYFVYGEAQDPARLRAEYLETALEISEMGDSAIYLLNPQVTGPEGEWEAWLLANWLPGAKRYHSFWEMMQAEYASFISLRAHAARHLTPDDDAALAKLPGLAAELEDKIAVYRKVPPSANTGVDAKYRQGIIDGLELAQLRVRELQDQITSAGELRRKLKELAEDLEERAKQGTRFGPRAMNLDAILSQNMDQLFEQVREAAVAEGYREAAGIVRWFLNGA